MSYEVKVGDCLEVLKSMPAHSADAIVTDPPAGIGFMGKAWDKDKGGRDYWIAWMQEIAAECLRVLKPGGHALVWALPRTSHWTATAWENAGFEVRDRVAHFFGSGFPKSMDISKAIDKAAGAEREILEITGQRCGVFAHSGSGKPQNVDDYQKVITAPATDDAKQWEGWGTALKPACEDWWLLRKPLGEKTIAKNVLRHGTGGLNIDACRVGGCPGRWPAHLVLDDEAGAVLDEQAEGKSRFFYCPKPSKAEKEAGLDHFEHLTPGELTGGRKEGSRGLQSPRTGAGRTSGRRNPHPTVKSIALMTWLIKLITPPGGIVLDPFCGSGTTGCAAVQLGHTFLGIEQDPNFAEIANARIAYWQGECE